MLCMLQVQKRSSPLVTFTSLGIAIKVHYFVTFVTGNTQVFSHRVNGDRLSTILHIAVEVCTTCGHMSYAANKNKETEPNGKNIKK